MRTPPPEVAGGTEVGVRRWKSGSLWRLSSGRSRDEDVVCFDTPQEVGRYLGRSYFLLLVLWTYICIM